MPLNAPPAFSEKFFPPSAPLPRVQARWGAGGGKTPKGFGSAVFSMPTALPASENPLLYAYDYAPRDHSFGTVTGSWAATVDSHLDG